MRKNIKLSIYLVKEEFTNDSDILKSDILPSKISDGSNYSIYSSDIPDHPPLWSKFFNSIEGMNPTVSSTRVIVIKRVAIENVIKIFVMTFGQASSFVKDDVFVEQFGLKILLNTLDSNQIRQISKRSVGSNQKSTREQLPRGSDIFEFGFDSIHTKHQIVHFIFKFIVVLYLCILRFCGNIPFGAFMSCCNRLRESFRATKLQKVPRKSPRQDRKSVCRGESLNKCSGVL